MDVLPLRYQATIFTNSDDLKPEPNLVQAFFTEFIKWEVFPNVFKERTININALNPNGAIKPVEEINDRLQFISSNQSKKISFLSKRIDIESNLVGTNSIGEIEDFCNQVLQILDVVNNHSPKRANRISLVTSYYCPNSSSDYMNQCYQALFSSSKLPLNNSDPVDWTHRVTHRQTHALSDKQERLNYITTFGRGLKNPYSAQGVIVDRLEFHFDINTFQNNTEYRFNIKELKQFYISTGETIKQLRDDVVKLFIDL